MTDQPDDTMPEVPLLTDDEEKLWRDVVLASIEHHHGTDAVLEADSVICELRRRKRKPLLLEQLCRGCAHARSEHDGYGTASPGRCKHTREDKTLSRRFCHCTEFLP